MVNPEGNVVVRRGPGGMGGQSATSTDLLARANVDDRWPLIAWLLEIPAYRDAYNNYLAQALEQGLDQESLLARIDGWATILAPYANAEYGDESTHAAAVESLRNFVVTRDGVIHSYLAELE